MICNILQYNLLEMKPIRQTIAIISTLWCTSTAVHSPGFAGAMGISRAMPVAALAGWKRLQRDIRCRGRDRGRCRCAVVAVIAFEFQIILWKIERSCFVGLSRKGELP